MKKMLGIAAAAIALCGLMFTSCGTSSGLSKAEEAAFKAQIAEMAGPKVTVKERTEPRNYVFDLIDGDYSDGKAGVVNCPFNSYGPNYQGEANFFNLTLADPIKVGDTVEFYLKGTSNIDIPVLATVCVDGCAEMNYWGVLTPKEEHEADIYSIVGRDIKANEPFEYHVKWTITTAPLKQIKFILQYDGKEYKTTAAGKPAKITFERVVDSTNTLKE